jgi:flagellar motility protein MotE (MotC chaperone)
VGTPEFLAPERFAEGSKVGPPADIWALGVTFYCALEGFSPFHRNSEAGWQAIMLAILNEPPRRPSHSGPLMDVTLRMLRKDADKRATADQVISALEGILGTPTAPPPVAPVAPPPKESSEALEFHKATKRLTDAGSEARSGRGWRDRAARQPSAQDPQAAMRRQPGVSRQPEVPPQPQRQGGGGAGGNRFAEARDMIRNVGTDTGVAMLLAMSEADAASILSDCPAKLCGDLLQGISTARPGTAATILRTLQSTTAGRAFAYLRPQTASSLVAAMGQHEALRILDNTDERTVAAVLMELPVSKSATLVKSMYSRQRAAQVLTHVRPSTAAEILRDDAEFATGVLRHLSAPVRKQVTHHLTAGT